MTRQDDLQAHEVDLRRRQICAATLLAAAAPLAGAQAQVEDKAQDQAQDQAPAEPAWRCIDFDWDDATRQRAVPARLYWPARSAGPVPLLVFSHGIGGSREGYSYLGRHWAAQGAASLHVQHVGSDKALWFGNPFGMVGRLQAAAQEREALQRVRDLRFALDRLLDPAVFAPGEQIDRRRIVAAGHSYGANTSLLAVGARVRRGGQWLDVHEPRFSAAVLISAPPFYGERDLAAILGSVAVPTLHVTATEDVIQIPGYHSGVDDRIAVFDAVADPRKMLVVFNGRLAQHLHRPPGHRRLEPEPAGQARHQDAGHGLPASQPEWRRDGLAAVAPGVAAHRGADGRHAGLTLRRCVRRSVPAASGLASERGFATLLVPPGGGRPWPAWGRS